MSKRFPLGMTAPETDVVTLTASMVAQTVELSRATPRGRFIQRLHKEDGASLQRMLNAMQPDTYLRPHRHLYPPKSEAFIVLRGKVRFVEFNDTGKVARWIDMQADSEIFGVDIEPAVWHALIVLKPDSVIFEVKNGPYDKTSDKDFADWAPVEGTPEAKTYLHELIKKTGGIS